MFSEKFKTSLLEFMLGLEPENFDAYEDVLLKPERGRNNIQLSLVCLTNAMVYVFVQTSLGAEPTDAERKSVLKQLDICEAAISSYLEVGVSHIMLFAVNEQGDDQTVIYYRLPHSTGLTLLNATQDNRTSGLYDLIATQEMYFKRTLATNDTPSRGLINSGDDLFRSLSLKLDFASNDGERVKYDAGGTAYIRKRNNIWVQASDCDERKLLRLTIFGGFLGAHLFYQKKFAKGVLYLLSCGLFGIGWIFDAIELLLGVYKDKDGYYIIPPKINFIQIVLCFAVGILFTFGSVMLYKILFIQGNNILKTIAEAFSSNWSSAQQFT